MRSIIIWEVFLKYGLYILIFTMGVIFVSTSGYSYTKKQNGTYGKNITKTTITSTVNNATGTTITTNKTSTSTKTKKIVSDQEPLSGGNREDYVKVKDRACKGEKLSSGDLWQYGIFDAQVQGAVVSVKPGSSLGAKEFDLISKKFAQSNFHEGYYWARCSRTKLLILSTPSGYPLKQLSNVQYQLNPLSINHCSKYSINYAPSESGESKIIRPSIDLNSSKRDLFLNLDLLKEGTFSISCTTNKNELALLYLAPVKNGGNSIPLHTFLKSTLADVSSLVVWINNVRRKEGLASIDFTNKDLIPIGQELIKDKRVEHNLKKLASVKNYLQKKNLIFLGEDRVRAESFEKMIWLLWNSPTHRSLLLEKRATHGSIAYDHMNALVSIVLVEHQNTYRVSKIEQIKQDKINKKIIQNDNIY